MQTLRILLMVLSLLALPALAEPIYEFDNPTDRQRFKSFTEQMRCPKCQNQNLAGSDSMIAADLRRELYEQIEDGRSDKEIVDHMVARYGDYILYNPPLDKHTAVLWGAPFVLLLVGGIVVIVMLRRQRAEREGRQTLSADEQRRFDQLMSQAENDNTQTNKERT